MKVLLVICISTLCMALAIAEDYCKIDSCGENFHVGCNHNGDFSKVCQPKAELINLDGELKEKYIDLHNKLREKVASGNFGHLKPAAQMGSVTWDEELAMLATLNLKLCTFVHDHCRSTKNYKLAGQNLAASWSFPAYLPKEAVELAFKPWHDEYVNADMSVIDMFHNNGKMYGHFTAVVNERNSKIGCALLRQPEPNGTMTEYHTTCNYARNNVLGEQIYKSGTPASGCKTGTHPSYPSLCSSAEKYDV